MPSCVLTRHKPKTLRQIKMKIIFYNETNIKQKSVTILMSFKTNFQQKTLLWIKNNIKVTENL